MHPAARLDLASREMIKMIASISERRNKRLASDRNLDDCSPTGVYAMECYPT
jgi:hypothetical protein